MPPKGPPKKRKADGLDEVQPSSSSGGGAGPEVSASIDDTSGGQTGQQQQTTTNVGILYPALKPPDGGALFRRDLQWDVLENIFNSVTYRFTPPQYPDEWTALFPQDRTWSFAELFLDCIANSSKANKNLKDKMNESTGFAVNFSKLCLLINVGRINTTLAFYPEMKTALRTYHPIPSMQLDEYSRKNLQDAPRMKSQLKGCFMPTEADNLPDSLAELIRRATVVGWQPPACVVQCIFLLFNEHSRITQKYLPDGITLHDLFWPGDPTDSVPSDQRSEAFLWLVHRFLETPHLVTEDFKTGEAKLPSDQLLRLEKCDCSRENLDTEEELQFATDMRLAREDFVKKYVSEENALLASQGTVSKDSLTASQSQSSSAVDKKGTKSASRASTPRASSTAPAAPAASTSKHARQHTDASVYLTAPLTTPSKLVQSTSSSPSTSVSALVTVTKAQDIERDLGPPSLASGSSTPTAIGPSDMQNEAGRLVDQADYYPEIHQYTYAYSIEAMKGKRAETQVPRLVPVDEGIAEPQIMHQWGQYLQLAPEKERSLLIAAWQKLKRDMDAERDPVYDSEEEAEWTLPDLQARLSGFLFRNYKREAKDVMRYQGAGPDLQPEMLSQHVQAMLEKDTQMSAAARRETPVLHTHSSPVVSARRLSKTDDDMSLPQNTDDEDRYASEGLSMTDEALPMEVDTALMPVDNIE